MNIEAMTRLADLLEADAADPTGMKFNLNHWIRGHRNAYDKPYKRNCGTTGCAIGLALTDQWFIDQGLRHHEYIYYHDQKSGKTYTNWEALQELFGINYWNVIYLFSPTSYSETLGSEAELTVAARLRTMLAEHNN